MRWYSRLQFQKSKNTGMVAEDILTLPRFDFLFSWNDQKTKKKLCA